MTSMVHNCLISVVIPSYNRADTVGMTIDSILAQRVDVPFEIVIGDDCSTDNAREVLLGYRERYPDAIRLLLFDHNIGLGANWATCVKECQGKYICNCDNDDYWHNPDKLQIQFDYMESHPECNICITNHRTHNRKTGKIEEHEAFIDRSISLQQAFFQGREHFCNATIMYRADFLKKHLPLDDFIKYHFYLQDWTAWMILSRYTDIDILPVSTATFGIETVSITRPDSFDHLKKQMDQRLVCYKYCCDMFPDLGFDEVGWKRYVDRLLLDLAYKKWDWGKAKEIMSRGEKGSRKKELSKNLVTFYARCLAKSVRRFLRRF